MEDTKIAILGLAIEGTALFKFLEKKYQSISILDKNSKEAILANANEKIRPDVENILNNANVDKVLGDHYLNHLEEFDLVYRSPAIYFNNPRIIEAKRRGTKFSSQIQLFMELCPCQIVGVTGTKGKGTTASLIAKILELSSKQNISKIKGDVYLAGNIGEAAISLISRLNKEDIVVLELSNFQLADLPRSPQIAVVTNMGVDHLDYHKDIAEYHVAKESILRYQTEKDFCILNKNSTFDNEFLVTVKSKKLFFSKSDDKANGYVGEFEGENTAFLNGEMLCKESEVKLVGRFNLENIIAASLVAEILGIDRKTIKEAVCSFDPLDYRLQLVAEIEGVKYINDSFATNPGPTIAAIESFKEPKILILGGSSKRADFHELVEVIKRHKVSAVVLIGDEGEKIYETLAELGYSGMIYEAGYSLVDAIKLAKIEAKAQGCKYIIFSPACASFDMFMNYKDRGEKFKEAVLKLQDATD